MPDFLYLLLLFLLLFVMAFHACRTKTCVVLVDRSGAKTRLVSERPSITLTVSLRPSASLPRTWLAGWGYRRCELNP